MEQKPSSIKWLVPAKLPGVELLLIENDLTKWHYFHERYAFAAAPVASTQYRYRGRLHTLGNGDTMLLEPSETHRNLTAPRPQTCQVVFVDPALFETAGREHGLSTVPHFRSALVADRRFLTAVHRLCASVEANETVLSQQSRLAVCLRMALQYAEQTLPETPSSFSHYAIKRVQTYLQERFNESVSLDELCEVSGLSPFHLVRSFARTFGMPPHAYQIHVRVERARNLLQSGMMPAEVALHLGFADQSHFTRHFQRIMQITPARYARAVV